MSFLQLDNDGVRNASPDLSDMKGIETHHCGASTPSDCASALEIMQV